MLTPIGLPLLIVNGKLQSLSSMTVSDLETFIPYLVKCSVTKAGACLINGIPPWWRSVVQCKFPLQKPSGLSLVGYRRHLASIVCSCYWYHDCQYLIGMCSEIAQNPQSIFVKNNEDDTTSVFYVKTAALILKFNNENKNYDKIPRFNGGIHRRSLLPSVPKATTIPDIYLCENCDAEFSSHTEMQKHEKVCFEVVIDDDDDDDDYDKKNDNENHNDDEDKNSNCSDSSIEIEFLGQWSHLSEKTKERNDFFTYLNLNPCNHYPITQLKPKKGLESMSKRWVNTDLCLHKNRNVEFSSLSGRKMLERNLKRDVITNIEKSIRLYESYCSSYLRTYRDQKEGLDFKVTYKRKEKDKWNHQYSFGKNQRTNRYKTLQTGLDENSRKLLKKCKRLSIVLTRLKLPS